MIGDRETNILMNAAAAGKIRDTDGERILSIFREGVQQRLTRIRLDEIRVRRRSTNRDEITRLKLLEEARILKADVSVFLGEIDRRMTQILCSREIQ